MTLLQLKQIYIDKHNINAVNQIVEIEDIQNKTGLSINKIINYLLANCTSKINRKTLNLLEYYFPLKSNLSLDDINKIVNRNFLSKETEINTTIDKEQETPEDLTEIKILKYKNIKKKKKEEQPEIKQKFNLPMTIEKREIIKQPEIHETNKENNIEHINEKSES